MSKRRGLPETSRMRHDSHFVDQLVRADELPIGRKIPLQLIDPNPDQPRSVLGDLSDLKHSISDKGVLEPILVRPREDGRFTIISGERRYRASIEAGLTEIPCIEMDVPDNELLEIALIENLQRKDLNPFEEADGYLALQQKHGYTHEDVARAVGKSRVTITETLHLARMSEPVKDECRRADINSKSFLLELARLDDPSLQLQAIAAYRQKESNRDTLREAKKTSNVRSTVVGMSRAFSMAYAPHGAPYRIQVVLQGEVREKAEILRAIRDLAARISSGELDPAKEGKFARRKPTTPGSEPAIEDESRPEVVPDDGGEEPLLE